MALIRSTEEFAEYANLNSVFSFDKIKPIVNDVQQDLFEVYCGAQLIQKLDLAYAGVTLDTLDEPDQELLKKILPALAPISLTRYIPIGEVQFDGRGVTTFGSTESRSAADNQQILRLRTSLLSMGMNAFERLLTFLEDNIADYPDHQVILDKRPKSILPNARVFSEFYQIFDSHLTYRGLISIISRIEEDSILPILGELYDDIFNSSLSAEMAALKRKAQRALAYSVVADAIELNMAIDLSAEGLRLNYSSEFGNLPYYRPPGDRTRETVLAAAKRKSEALLDQLLIAVGTINGSNDSGLGLVDSTDMGIVII